MTGTPTETAYNKEDHYPRNGLGKLRIFSKSRGRNKSAGIITKSLLKIPSYNARIVVKKRRLCQQVVMSDAFIDLLQ